MSNLLEVRKKVAEHLANFNGLNRTQLVNWALLLNNKLTREKLLGMPIEKLQKLVKSSIGVKKGKTISTEKRLKRCVFCESNMLIISVGRQHGCNVHYAECTNPSCELRTRNFETREDAIKWWNSQAACGC